MGWVLGKVPYSEEGKQPNYEGLKKQKNKLVICLEVGFIFLGVSIFGAVFIFQLIFIVCGILMNMLKVHDYSTTLSDIINFNSHKANWAELRHERMNGHSHYFSPCFV